MVPTARDIEQVFERYVAAGSTRDVNAIAALFASNAVVHDPVDGPAVEGRDKIRAFMAEFGASVRVMRLAGPVHISADCRHAAARIDADAALDEGTKLVEALDVFTFGDDGLILTRDAYWGPTNFHDA
jgi:steroid delta-isomerase